MGITSVFDGVIDEVRIYSRALTADEIKALADPDNAWDGAIWGKTIYIVPTVPVGMLMGRSRYKVINEYIVPTVPVGMLNWTLFVLYRIKKKTWEEVDTK